MSPVILPHLNPLEGNLDYDSFRCSASKFPQKALRSFLHCVGLVQKSAVNPVVRGGCGCGRVGCLSGRIHASHLSDRCSASKFPQKAFRSFLHCVGLVQKSAVNPVVSRLSQSSSNASAEQLEPELRVYTRKNKSLRPLNSCRKGTQGTKHEPSGSGVQVMQKSERPNLLDIDLHRSGIQPSAAPSDQFRVL